MAVLPHWEFKALCGLVYEKEKWDLADRLDAFIEDFEQRLQAITEKTLPPAAGIGRVDLSDGH